MFRVDLVLFLFRGNLPVPKVAGWRIHMAPSSCLNNVFRSELHIQFEKGTGRILASVDTFLRSNVVATQTSRKIFKHSECTKKYSTLNIHTATFNWSVD